MRRFEDAVGVGPLRHGVQLLIDSLPFVRSDILRNHIYAHGCYHIGDAVLNKRVDMVRSRRQHNDHASGFLCRTEHFEVASLQPVKVLLLRIHRM